MAVCIVLNADREREALLSAEHDPLSQDDIEQTLIWTSSSQPAVFTPTAIFPDPIDQKWAKEDLLNRQQLVELFLNFLLDDPHSFSREILKSIAGQEMDSWHLSTPRDLDTRRAMTQMRIAPILTRGFLGRDIDIQEFFIALANGNPEALTLYQELTLFAPRT